MELNIIDLLNEVISENLMKKLKLLCSQISLVKHSIK